MKCVGECLLQVESTQEEIACRDALVDHHAESTRGARCQCCAGSRVAVRIRVGGVFFGLGRSHREVEARIACGPVGIESVGVEDIVLPLCCLQTVIVEGEGQRVLYRHYSGHKLHFVGTVPVSVLRSGGVDYGSLAEVVHRAAGGLHGSAFCELQRGSQGRDVGMAAHAEGDGGIAVGHSLNRVGELEERVERVADVHRDTLNVGLRVGCLVLETGAKAERCQQQEHLVSFH